MIKRYTHLLNEFSRKSQRLNLFSNYVNQSKLLMLTHTAQVAILLNKVKTLEKFLSILEKVLAQFNLFREGLYNAPLED